MALRRKSIPEVTRRMAVIQTQKGPGMFTVSWLKDTLERSLKTFAQSALATLGLGATNVLAVDWVGVLSIGAGAAIISVLTSVASEPIGVGGTASLTKAVEPTPTA